MYFYVSVNFKGFFFYMVWHYFMWGWAANKKQMCQFPAGLMVKGHMTVHTGSMGKGDLCFVLMDFSFKCQRVSYLSQKLQMSRTESNRICKL